MNFDDVKDAVVTILQAAEGRFLTAYQICDRIEESVPQLWEQLKNEYPSVHAHTPMGEGTGKKYSPATFVASALNYFGEKKKVADLKQEKFECKGVSFDGIAPGFTGNVVGIWAIQGSNQTTS